MDEFFRSPVWQFVGAVVAILAIVASIVLYRLQRRSKRLVYEVVSRTNLLTASEELENKVQVLYDGNSIGSLTIFLVRVWNPGTEPIKASDFERPLSFPVSAPARVLTAAITEASPEGVTPTLESSASLLKVAPMLLNKGDSFTIKVLVSDTETTLQPDARIVGVSRIQKGSAHSRKYLVLAACCMLMVLGGIISVAYFSPKPVNQPPTPLAVKISVAVIIIAYILGGYGFIRSGTLRRFNRILRRLR